MFRQEVLFVLQKELPIRGSIELCLLWLYAKTLLIKVLPHVYPVFKAGTHVNGDVTSHECVKIVTRRRTNASRFAGTAGKVVRNAHLHALLTSWWLRKLPSDYAKELGLCNSVRHWRHLTRSDGLDTAQAFRDSR